MKNSIILLGAILCLSLSCKEAQKVESSIAEKPKNEVNNKEGYIPCFSDEKVYPETVWLWSKSWLEYYNFVNETKETKDTISPNFYFSHRNIKTLQSYNPINDSTAGVLIYYIFKEPVTEENKKKKIPSLAIINTTNCKLVTECSANAIDNKCVLVKWRGFEGNEGKEEFITVDNLHKYQKYWIESDEIREKIMPGYLPVNGYNYSWKTINSILNPIGGLRVKYGVRTLGPGEIFNFTPPSDAVPIDQTGNAVFCNVILGWEKKEDNAIDREKSFRDAINNLTANAVELDFAKPCPQHCGND